MKLIDLYHELEKIVTQQLSAKDMNAEVSSIEVGTNDAIIIHFARELIFIPKPQS